MDIGAVKVFGAHMLRNVIDRAVQVYGAAASPTTHRWARCIANARFARTYDGADEVHISTVGRRILAEYRNGGSWEFGLR